MERAQITRAICSTVASMVVSASARGRTGLAPASSRRAPFSTAVARRLDANGTAPVGVRGWRRAAWGVVLAAVLVAPAQAQNTYLLRLYNIDDVMTAFIINNSNNNTQILQETFNKDTGLVDVHPYVTPGYNHITVQDYNDLGGWSYGYEFLVNGLTVASGSCGTVNVIGCNNNNQTQTNQVVFQTQFEFLGDPTNSHDFNGDGYSDILWADGLGNAAIWLVNGTKVLQQSILGYVPPSWSVVAARDFDGDGTADLLWRDNAGNLALWLMNGTQVTQTTLIGNVPTSWTVVGTSGAWTVPAGSSGASTAAGGSSGAVGSMSLYWTDNLGNLAVWQMNGTQVMQSALLGNVGTSWKVAGASPPSGSGGENIYWTDNSGNVAVWQMNGTQVAQTASLGNVGTSWSLIGTGDFNGDGNTDLLWRDQSGNLATWLMNGTQVTQSVSLGNVPTTWSVAQTGDYNGDGTTDILWHDNLGNVAAWFINGAAITSTGSFGNVGTSWQIQAANSD